MAMEKVSETGSNVEPLPEKLTSREIISLNLQIFWGWVTILPLTYGIIYVLRFILKYRIRDINKVRAEFKKLTKTNRPILICPNHMTMIDSIILIWASGSMLWYFFHYRKFSWNVPAIENFKNTPVRSIITYLSKCIPVDRTGSRHHHQTVLLKTYYLLKKKNIFTYFPEGGRSRKGRIDMDNVRYGVGKIVAEIPDIKVLCVYMRGDNQKDHSDIPQKGETIEIAFRELNPSSKSTGLRAHREHSYEIMETLKSMEEEYFQNHPDNR